MSYTPFVIAWGVLALILAVLVVWRTKLGFNEDDSLHLATGEIPAEKEQIAKARSIDAVDRWEKILTAIIVVYGLALVGTFAYQQLY